MRWLTASLLVFSGCALLSQSKEVAELAAEGESRDLPGDHAPRSALTEKRPDLFIIGIDGVDRDLLYGMLRAGQLPNLARLIGGRAGGFPHAHFDERVLSTLPSNTLTAWAALFTGAKPAANGIASNEFFIRAKGQYAAPGPVSSNDATPSMKSYTEDYADDLLTAPTIYQQIRARDPGVRIWVSMSQFHRGADRLLTASQSVLTDAFRVFLDQALTGKDDATRMETYAALDREVLDTLASQLADRDRPLPDVLTLYLAGTDLFAHVAEAGPDAARRAYLTKVVDPGLGKVVAALARRRALSDRFVIVISDHGHTPVLGDEQHALGDRDDGKRPADVLEQTGFRVRPAGWKADDDDFQAVIAYNGAFGLVYLADRSTCADKGSSCDFRRPPRWEQDVLPAAEAFHRANQGAPPVPALRGTIDLILVRRGSEGPFRVYLGGGKTADIDRALALAPHPGYVQVASRLRDLAVGPHGDRAGDIVLMTRSGAVADIHGRYYFSHTYRSWHGSPSRRDSEIPFILAHPMRTSRELGALADRHLGSTAIIDEVGRLLVDLRLER